MTRSRELLTTTGRLVNYAGNMSFVMAASCMVSPFILSTANQGLSNVSAVGSPTAIVHERGWLPNDELLEAMALLAGGVALVGSAFKVAAPKVDNRITKYDLNKHLQQLMIAPDNKRGNS